MPKECFQSYQQNGIQYRILVDVVYYVSITVFQKDQEFQEDFLENQIVIVFRILAVNESGGIKVQTNIISAQLLFKFAQNDFA